MSKVTVKSDRTSLWRRYDSLFIRLLFGHVILAVSLTLVLTAVFYVERNQTLAAILADQWAEPLAKAAGLPSTDITAPDIQYSMTQPADTHMVSPYLPRMVALKERLASRGLHISGMAIHHRGNDTTVWLRIDTRARGPQWIGMSGPLVEHDGGGRIALAIAVSSVLVLSIAWRLSRRMAIPLERLSKHIRHGKPLPMDSSGAPPEFVAISDAYTALLERLAQQDRERSLMLAGISHDLRSPLGRIRLAVELLPQMPEGESGRHSIVRNVQIMDRLVGSFLDLTRVGELKINEAVDLVSVARQVVSDHPHASGALTLEAPASLVLSNGNHLLLEQLMANLLDNAFKHGRPPVKIRLHSRGDAAIIEVEDAGPGIDASQQSVVLDAFARGDTARLVPGLGLGLAIVKQGVGRLGGQFEFDSRPGCHIARIRLFGLR